MARNVKVDRLFGFVSSVPLTNGEKVRLATAILDTCGKTPRSKMGELFDKCMKALHYLSDVSERYEVRLDV